MTNNSKTHQQRRLPLLLALLFLSAVGVFCDSGANVKMRIFQGPKDLNDMKTEEYKLSLGNFGYVPWGKTITGIVYPANAFNACQPIENIQLDDEESSAPIVLVERGGCTFVTKVANARAQGARMVIIVNNKDEDVGFVEMVEDNTGVGKSIDIPTVMVSQKQGKKLKKYVQMYYENLQLPEKKKNKDIHPVVMYVKFDWNKKEKANVEMWLSPGSPKSMDFVASFKDKNKRVFKEAEFKPRYAIWPCESCKVDNKWKENNDNCLGGGRYCQPTPDNTRNVTGAQMVEESLRQLCIFKEFKDNYFEYIKSFNRTCVSGMIFNKTNPLANIKSCSEEIMKEVTIPAQTINNCVKDSWKDCKDQPCENDILEEERKTFSARSIAVWPAVIINSQTFKGNLIADEVMNAVCMGFKKLPEACSNYVVKPEEVVSDPNSYQDGNFWGKFFWVLFLLAIVMVIFFYFYRRVVRRAMVDEMNDQIQSAVATYFKMGDNKTANNA